MGAKSHATPSVRAFARELGVDLSRVTGTGPKGRVKREDVSSLVKRVMSGAGPARAAGSAGFSLPPIPTADYEAYGEIEVQELSRIKKISGPHLHRNWIGVPHVTQFEDADITDLEDFRKELNTANVKSGGPKISPLIFIIKAAVQALKEFPDFNSSLGADGATLIRKKYYNIGIAVDTPGGLMVPVVKNADRKGVLELAEDLGDLSSRAREGKLKADEMKGGTFSISSLGGIGGTYFTPIVNAPEVAILGLSKSAMKPVWDGKTFQPRLILPFSVSYDPRVIDGASGARFAAYLSQLLADMRRALL
jgi:pyruvate dehydrogenase E2 component (dihydrolipoamide acetyltransferase)